MKSFGQNRERVERVPFELNYLDVDEEPQVASFQAVPRLSGGDIAGVMHALEHKPEQSISRLIRLLSKAMDNKDGLVKASWSPEEVDGGGKFRGPDGELYEMGDKEALARFEDKSSWTSRRRWNHLLLEDDEAVVEFKDLQEIAEWLIGETTDRPTQPRA